MSTLEENAKIVAELLKVLSNENRLLIVCSLIEKPLTVTEIANYIPNITQSSISQHLAILKSHNVLDSDKNGQNVTYFIKDNRIVEILNVIKKHYC